ncbi:hypothetical protein GCM10027036_36770 [Flavihumibacter cheonanensis]|jgi:hypothetical protein|uniref:hypothetical protein n=1 Tax=Flavihumibacter cheonanensis TaxID=1442385 RepID=UPI001EF890FA|nr:hypothetical protein [Flavihumibacter cheonanensis]MCG7753680.1 hypothetical protein [Flavihumibacter cheonanensis]
MNIPYGLIAIFIALSFFYYVSQKSRIRREEKQERLNEKRQELLDTLVKKNTRKSEDSA